MDSQGLGDKIKDYKWEMNLVESKEVNAWCMPGGKVVVYTGILPVTKTDAGLAVVLGHEIGHAIAQHGSERMSQGLIAQMGGMALGEALKTKPAANAAVVDDRVRRRRSVRRVASVQPTPGKRSRQDRLGPDGDGGLRPA
jgi:predicted Zn-dependent protease